MTNERGLTDGRELAAYLGLHVLGLVLTFTVFPGIFASMAKAGQAAMVSTVAILLHFGMMLAVLLLFLVVRKALRGDGPARVTYQTAPHPLSASASPQPGPSVNTQGTALAVVSIVLGLLGGVPGIGILMSIAGIVCGMIARGQARRTGNASGATIAIIGIVLSSATLILAVILLTVLGGTVFSLMR